MLWSVGKLFVSIDLLKALKQGRLLLSTAFEHHVGQLYCISVDRCINSSKCYYTVAGFAATKWHGNCWISQSKNFVLNFYQARGASRDAA